MQTNEVETGQLEELLATTYLNMAQCFFQTQQYQKSVEKATFSLGFRRSTKALFRRAMSGAARKDYEGAIKDLEEALTLEQGNPDQQMTHTI